MMSRVILVAMLPPSGATLRDLRATTVKETGRTRRANRTRASFSRPLMTWASPASSSPILLTYASPSLGAIRTGAAGRLQYIDVYDVQRAVEDGATVRIYYEGRLAKIELKDEER